MTSKSDQEIVKLSLEDSDNFLELMNRYEAPLLRYIHRLCRVSEHDAEDILQETFISTYQNLNNYDPQLKFSSWIYRITHNKAISHYRKNKNPSISLDDNEVLYKKLKSDLDLPTETEQKMEKERIGKILDTLSPKYRDVLVLKFLEDKDYTEISDILKIPMGTVATQINRAKKQLKKLIQKNA
ncbi:sigma-70 family RNA polymerase sigma factor [Candidatus Gracilibacteria bacterium]|nr:sigma-70 family RNA polymerase sigma factor [Candidatus Gracilibacteria bacterium]